MAQEYFTITRVSRDDIIAQGFPAEQVNALTDAQMESLAESMHEDYLAQLYWGQIDDLVPMLFDIEKPEDEGEVDEDAEYERERDKRTLE